MDVLEPVPKIDELPFTLSFGPCRHEPSPQHDNEGVNKVKVIAKPKDVNRIVVRLSLVPVAAGRALDVNPLREWGTGAGPFKA